MNVLHHTILHKQDLRVTSQVYLKYTDRVSYYTLSILIDEDGARMYV